MTVRAKLKDLAPGTVFNAGPIDVRVLEHFADGRTLLIADTCIADRHFADQPFKTRPEKPAANPNDWRFSSLNFRFPFLPNKTLTVAFSRSAKQRPAASAPSFYFTRTRASICESWTRSSGLATGREPTK